ncbi:MAG: hypothetical protein FWD68_21320 [Alphaproteobacteria bacterium]|nr:hypothetical protein [Alphaproteobacteria bacterium]
MEPDSAEVPIQPHGAQRRLRMHLWPASPHQVERSPFDLRFQLFDGAARRAALLIFGNAGDENSGYRFGYFSPKADLNLKGKRLITLSSADRCFITSRSALSDPLVFKRPMWISEPDARLFRYLSAFSKLGNIITEYGSQMHTPVSATDGWMIGQGFKPHNSSSHGYHRSAYVSALPHLSVAQFEPLAVSRASLTSCPSSRVHRKGFERGFEGPRIIIPQGIGIAQMRLRAAYGEDAFTFQDSLQAISVPAGEEVRAKLLTALLNSRVAVWYAFHGTSSFGSDRPKRS